MTVVVDKFTKTQEMIAQIYELRERQIKELERNVDDLREQQIKEIERKTEQIIELERKTEGLWYAVVALSTIMAVHILYHVLPPLMDFFFGL